MAKRPRILWTRLSRPLAADPGRFAGGCHLDRYAG